MRLKEHLLAIAGELERLRAEGVTTVPVDDATLAELQKLSDTTPDRPAEARLESPKNPAPQREIVRAVVDVPRPAPKAVPAPQAPDVALPEGDKNAKFDWLVTHVTSHPEVIRHVRPGKKAVVGVGNLDAAIMFVGEAPGGEEEIQGEPFVGPAGQLLTKMIKGMGLDRGEVYIGNIMNWRPEMATPEGGEQVGNRPPTAEEMSYCLPFLRAQIAIVNPRVIVAVGATAAKGLLGADAVPTLGAVKGRWHDFGGTPLMITYHPSYLLRNNSNRAKRSVWEDLLLVIERVGLPVSAKQRDYFL